ncbi:hypothetical protein EOPP23_11965 [Endozoicomonas sp. OPT23]|uniref:hypothetical protein n=1 Tax=Endozoicomonas sp. OPT23 TaxID=2072845 RepID=UPI00129B5FCD|nr:hypothetical protein [Endozoicomonas sp. OPT23]MRI33702.1 hypothetical protein [Endozoicomonas sp. OPT23]
MESVTVAASSPYSRESSIDETESSDEERIEKKDLVGGYFIEVWNSIGKTCCQLSHELLEKKLPKVDDALNERVGFKREDYSTITAITKPIRYIGFSALASTSIVLLLNSVSLPAWVTYVAVTAIVTSCAVYLSYVENEAGISKQKYRDIDQQFQLYKHAIKTFISEMEEGHTLMSKDDFLVKRKKIEDLLREHHRDLMNEMMVEDKAIKNEFERKLEELKEYFVETLEKHDRAVKTEVKTLCARLHEYGMDITKANEKIRDCEVTNASLLNQLRASQWETSIAKEEENQTAVKLCEMHREKEKEKEKAQAEIAVLKETVKKIQTEKTELLEKLTKLKNRMKDSDDSDVKLIAELL